MIDASIADVLLKLVLTLARSGAPVRQKTRLAALEILAFSCFVGAIGLGLVAIGLALAPSLGAAGAIAVDAVLLALIGLALFAWTRGRSKRRTSSPAAAPLEALVGEIFEHLKREKGISIVAGLLAGMLVGGSRK